MIPKVADTETKHSWIPATSLSVRKTHISICLYGTTVEECYLSFCLDVCHTGNLCWNKLFRSWLELEHNFYSKCYVIDNDFTSSSNVASTSPAPIDNNSSSPSLGSEYLSMMPKTTRVAR